MPSSSTQDTPKPTFEELNESAIRKLYASIIRPGSGVFGTANQVADAIHVLRTMSPRKPWPTLPK